MKDSAQFRPHHHNLAHEHTASELALDEGHIDCSDYYKD